jgi:hypothetical protein
MPATTKASPTIWTKPWHWFLRFDAALHHDETARLWVDLARANDRIAHLEAASRERIS